MTGTANMFTSPNMKLRNTKGIAAISEPRPLFSPYFGLGGERWPDCDCRGAPEGRAALFWPAGAGGFWLVGADDLFGLTGAGALFSPVGADGLLSPAGAGGAGGLWPGGWSDP